MIKKFEEFVEEGFMTRTLDRNKSGEKRIENRFLKSDVEVFNFKSLYKFIDQYGIYDWFRYDLNKLLHDTYDDVMIKYANSHGIINLGFDIDDESKLPDFEHKITIPKLKDVSVFINYIDSSKDIIISCGNNKKEFDISETKFGLGIKKIFDNLFVELFLHKPNILIHNLKLHWETFKELIEREVYNRTYHEVSFDRKGNFDITPIGGIDIIPMSSEDKKLRKFLFGGVDYRKPKNPKVYVGGDAHDISNTEEGQEILKIYKDSYSSAVHDVLQKYP